MRPAVLLLIGCGAGFAQTPAPTFKAETNLVLVPVVVRDAKGEVVGNLTKNDFRVFDNGREQAIVSFSVQESSAQVAQDRSLAPENAAGPAGAAVPAAQAMVVPQHFVALLFDDQHSKNCDPDPPGGYIGCVGDLWYARDAARKLIKNLQPGDRVGVFTSTGNVSLDFTSDRAKIEEALLKLREGTPVMPTVGNSGLRERQIEEDTHDAVQWSRDVVRRMTHLPGRRTVVFLSPGLLLHGQAWSEVGTTNDLIDNAIRSKVVINSLDTRGLSSRGGEFHEFQMRVTDGTGGTFIRDTNDLDGAVARLAGTPKYIYVLGFSPRDVKPDGSFHKLSVKLDQRGLDVQARSGYQAPDARQMAQQKQSGSSAPEQPHFSEAETQQVARTLGITAEAPVTFRAQTNLVLVPVVVRDAKGDTVGDLQKDDFQLSRDGKPRTISSFTVEETSGGHAAVDRSVGDGPKAGSMIMPEHFVSIVFDDADFDPKRYEDIVYPRKAVLKYLDTLQPADRVAFFTPSGFYTVDFTTDKSKIRDVLMKMIPGPPAPLRTMTAEQKAKLVISQCEKIIQRMSLLPGQRTLLFVSSGMQVQAMPAWSAVPETMRMIDHAIRSRVVMNTMDARGLDVASAATRAWEFQLGIADGTGGKFIRDTNDLDGAVRQLAATPKYIYVLGFSPDGDVAKPGFHKLEVKLRDRPKLDIQARAGYWDADAPMVAEKGKQPAAAAKPETPHYSAEESKELAQALDLTPAASPVSAVAATAPPKNDEIVTKDQPVTFKVESNLVEVPVVVRDKTGHAIGNLTQDDFRIFDKGKRQQITKFAMVKGNNPAATPAAAPAEPVGKAPAPASPTLASASPVTPPSRFVAFVFDDIHLHTEDVQQVRAAVVKYLNASVGPQDRVALFTTSGRQVVEFTDHPGALNQPLLKVSPSPLSDIRPSGCGAYVSYFQAVQVDHEVGLNPMQSDLSKSLSLRVAVNDYGDFNTAVMALRDAYTSGIQESRATLATLKLVVKRMAPMPGQRNIVLVSPGLFVPFDLENESNDLMALAIRSKVLISTIDARGVWTNPAYDACRPGASAQTIRDQVEFHDLDEQASTDELIALGEGTGGAVNLNNDFLGGIRNAAATPEFMYVLGFVPENLKLDGSFHALKVTVGGAEKLSLQARRGYWAPKHAEDEIAVSKQEIEDAVFSRDEIHNLPVDMHTQLTKVGDQSKLNVLTSVDLKAIHLRKAEDRNRNDITIVAALFDTNGNFLLGTQKLLELRLRDETVTKLEEKPPVVIATDFDVKPGGYLVRLVVRDAEGRELTAENAAVMVQ